MNEKELKILCENAALATTGKRVKVRLVAPITKQFDGEVYNSPSGYVINIRPELSDENFIWTLCHEIGHVRMNHISDISPDKEPGSMMLTPAGEMSIKVKPEIVSHEKAAQSWGDKYLQYAEENYHLYSGLTKLERQLRALSGYLSPELQMRAGQIGTHSGLKALERVKSMEDEIELNAWKQEQIKKGR